MAWSRIILKELHFYNRHRSDFIIFSQFLCSRTSGGVVLMEVSESHLGSSKELPTGLHRGDSIQLLHRGTIKPCQESFMVRILI